MSVAIHQAGQYPRAGKLEPRGADGDLPAQLDGRTDGADEAVLPPNRVRSGLTRDDSAGANEPA